MSKSRDAEGSEDARHKVETGKGSTDVGITSSVRAEESQSTFGFEFCSVLHLEVDSFVPATLRALRSHRWLVVNPLADDRSVRVCLTWG